MTTWAVLVNGLPGSGKTTLAGPLATTLGVPLIAKDTLKEAMAAAPPYPAAPPLAGSAPAGNRSPLADLGRAVADAMWDLAAAVPGGVVLESWWFAPRDRRYAAAGLRPLGNPPTAEVWCDVPAAVARERYAHRTRPALYEDARHLTDSWPRWAAEATPLHLGPVITADTTTPVDLADLSARIRAALAR